MLKKLDAGIEIFRNPATAAAHWLRAEEAGQCMLFQSHAWGSAWFDTIGRARQVEPCLVRLTHGHGELFFPMAIEKKGYGTRSLGFLDGGLSDHAGPIMVGDCRVFSAAEMPRLARLIAALAKVDVIDWQHLTASVADAQNPLVTAKSQKLAYLTHRLDIRGSWPDFARDHLSTSHQSGSRRRWRRLASKGDARFVIATELEEALEIIEVTMRHKADRYRATGRGNPFAIEAYAEFYREMTRRHLSAGLVHVSALKCDDQVIASHWGCLYRNRFFWLMPSYDASWSKVSPGRLLLDHLVEWSFDQGLEAFDFTIGDEPYKNTFASHHDHLYRSRYVRTPLGLAYDLKDRLKFPPIS